jgi:hypothetical protein
MVAAGERYDLIYVDGSHVFEDVFIDAYYSFRLVSENGVVLFDDCRHSHVQKVIRFVRRNLKESFEEVDIGPFRLDKGRTMKYRLARLLREIQLTGFRRIGAAARPSEAWRGALNKF